MGLLKYLSVGTKSLKYKLLLAFSLMSIIPLLVITYLVTYYIFPGVPANTFQITAIVMFVLWVSYAGYILIKEIINPVINLALETKIIAEGQYDSKIMVMREDELGDIASAVNSMTGKMRNYIGELQDYSRKTAALNARVHRKVLTLTNLMRLGDLISTGADFHEITSFAADRIAGELYGGFCAIFMKEKGGKYPVKSFCDNSGKEVSVSKIEGELGDIEKLFIRNEYLLVDTRPTKKPWQKELKEKFGGMNMVMFPLKLHNSVIGVLVLANYASGATFSTEDIEVLRAFEKELVLGYQTSQAFEKVKDLEVVDTLTGLYTLSYLQDRLEDEINRAVYYQRPCSMIVLGLDYFDRYSDDYGVSKSQQVIKHIADMLGKVLPPIGKLARFEDHEFGILLPEMNKRESMEVAENLRKIIEELEISAAEGDRVTASIGVGENPIDGATGKEIIEKARSYMRKAREDGRNRVVGWM